MNENSKKDPPWQTTAKKLIKFAGEFKRASIANKDDDEFRRQVGYLLLDIGVETLLRSYLTQPNTKAKMSFTKRDEAAKGTIEKDNIIGKKITLSSFDELSFHNLIMAVKQVAEDTVDEGALEKAEYFHTIRNKIYHLGDGIIPTKQNFDEYLSLADNLLRTLLGTSNIVKNYYQDLDDIMTPMSEQFKKSKLEELETKVAILTEILHPNHATKIFEAKIQKIRNLYDEENVRESEEAMTYGFNKVMGTEIDDIDFIEKCVNDITYLRLIALQPKTDIDDNEIDKYLEFQRWADSPIKEIDEFTLEYAAVVKGNTSWHTKFCKKLDTLIEPHINQ